MGAKARFIPDYGKAFKGSAMPLPKELRTRIVEMKLDHVKKAGTQSNQRATAATAWMAHQAGTQFRSATMAWTGS